MDLQVSFGSFYVYLQLLQAPEDILRELTKEKVTINFHENCLTPTNFSRYILYVQLLSFNYLLLLMYCLRIIYLFFGLFRFNMGKFWKALSYNFDKNRLQYISTIEARNFPFIGVQFHPEKNIFEWATNTVGNIPHNK